LETKSIEAQVEQDVQKLKRASSSRFIYVLSDGSGETAINLIRALLTQFAGGGYAIYTRRYPKVKKFTQIDAIMESAREAAGPVFVAYTLVNPEMRNHLRDSIERNGLRGFDLFTTPLMELSAFLDDNPEANADLFHGVNEKYFKRMEAIEFTLHHDDGKRVVGLDHADIVLVGVSRTGKTPLSIYLSLYGYKVVNIPLAKGVKPPPELERIDQKKIVALTIDPSRLAEIRKRRLTGLNVNHSDYSNPGSVLEELEEAHRFFKKHRHWPVIDVTDRSIEETAGVVRDKVYGRDRLVD